MNTLHFAQVWRTPYCSHSPGAYPLMTSVTPPLPSLPVVAWPLSGDTEADEAWQRVSDLTSYSNWSWVINRPPGTQGDVGLVERGGARSCGVGWGTGGLSRPPLTQAFSNALINFKSSTSCSLALTRNRCLAEREGKKVVVVGETAVKPRCISPEKDRKREWWVTKQPRERMFQRIAVTLSAPPPTPPTGEADDSAISHLAERATDSSVLARRRTKQPAEKVTRAHIHNTHTHTGGNRMQ